jgi:hypothetical protein
MIRPRYWAVEVFIRFAPPIATVIADVAALTLCAKNSPEQMQ